MGKELTLVIMAAGLGSRYGGNKQVDAFGPNGEMLLEYSVYDAIEAGFTKIIFIISKNMVQIFKDKIESTVSRKCKVEFVVQDFDKLPGWYKVPDGRTKPFGTVAAILAAKELIKGSFCVINADDYYGKECYVSMSKALKYMQENSTELYMVGFKLKNTLSENGTVTRGVCEMNADGYLLSCHETTKIKKDDDGKIRAYGNSVDGILIDGNQLVSLNFWGLTVHFLELLNNYFEDFLRNLSIDDIRSECLLPIAINDLLAEKKCEVKVLMSEDTWFGVTYKEDHQKVCDKINDLIELGMYPTSLFNYYNNNSR